MASDALAVIDAEIRNGRQDATSRNRLLRVRSLLVATALAADGKLAEAERLLREAIEAQVADDAHDPSLAWYLATLGVVLAWGGRFEEAFESASAAGAIAAEKVPSDDPVHLTIHDCAGRAALVLGYYDEADRYLTQALAIVTQDVEREAVLAESAARARFHCGRYESAAHAAAQASTVYAAAGPPFAVAAIRARLLYGQALAAGGFRDRAVRMIGEAIDRLEREVGPGASELARPLETLAIATAGSGQFERAWRLVRQVVAIYRRDDGREAVSTADALYTAGLVAASDYEAGSGEAARDRAIACLAESARIVGVTPGTRSPRALGLLLGLLLAGRGEFEPAADALLDVLDQEADSAVAAAIRELAAIAAAAGQGLLGAELIRALRRKLGRTYGAGDPATLLATVDLATLLASAGLFDAALYEYRRAMPALEAVGLLTGVGFDSAINYALLLWRDGASSEAERVFAGAVAADLPSSLAARQRAADCLERMYAELRETEAGAESVRSAWIGYAASALPPGDPSALRAGRVAATGD